jgi:hypothetical protein
VQIRPENRYKFLTAFIAGLSVWLVSIAAFLALLPFDRALLPRQIVASFVGGLMTVIVALGIQLRQEEVHYRGAMERAAIVAELNHHVRNAVFPLCIAIQKVGDAEADKIVGEALDQLNHALRDATADALSRQVDYSENTVSAER